MATINNKIMKLEEAIGLVEEVRNCSLPWDDAHWEALGMVIEFVKNALNEKSLRPQNQWKPSEEQMATLEYYMHTLLATEHKEVLFGLYNDLKQL